MTREEIYAQMYSSDTVYPPPLEIKSALLEITTGCSYRRCKFCDFPKDTFSIFSMGEIAKKNRASSPGHRWQSTAAPSWMQSILSAYPAAAVHSGNDP